MKYKIQAGTDTYNLLLSVKEKINIAQAEARALLKELGGSSYKEAVGKLAGGISAVKFASKKEGWRQSNSDGFYRPRAKNVALIAKLSNLPTVEISDFNNIINFKSQYISAENGIVEIDYPDISFRKDYILISVDNGCEYTPTKDLVEILESEFVRLFNLKTDDQSPI